MTERDAVDPIAQLQDCLALAAELKRHPEADQAFNDLRDRLATQPLSPQLVDQLLKQLWDAVLAGRRSASFWEQISDVERQISEDMAASHYQLQQNYLRLMQEQ